MYRPLAFSFPLLAVLLTASASEAQDIPKGTTKDESVTKGKTEVATDTYETAAPRDKDKDKDATELTFTAGGLASTGNSRLLALTGAASFRLRRDDNQLTALFAGNYGRSAAGQSGMQTNTENLQGRVRYDRFFAKDWTFFLGTQARRDRFAGLALRLQVDPGVAYYFVNEEHRLFWAELGYDYLHDIRRDDALIPVDDKGNPIPGAPLLDKSFSVHSARAFLGYKYKINEGVSMGGGLEFLQGLSDTGVRRVNGEIVVTSKFSKAFALATSFLFRYDNAPLPGKETLDTATSVSLVYNWL